MFSQHKVQRILTPEVSTSCCRRGTSQATNQKTTVSNYDLTTTWTNQRTTVSNYYFTNQRTENDSFELLFHQSENDSNWTKASSPIIKRRFQNGCILHFSDYQHVTNLHGEWIRCCSLVFNCGPSNSFSLMLTWFFVSFFALCRPKGCSNLALPKSTVVIWSAPFLSGGGYCTEVCPCMTSCRGMLIW